MERVLAGRYRLEQRLASGGMAAVYRAVDLDLARPVAIKLPHPHLSADPTFAERLRREARAVAALNHPNVVALYAIGQEAGELFLVMELVEGESLASLLAHSGALAVQPAVAIAEDVLAALQHAHGRGVLHRDVKPHNVLLAPGGQAKLADFGIAEAVDATSLTCTGEILGSVRYLAPERLAGTPATAVADVYAAGVVLYQMLTGRVPFDADLPVAVAVQHQQQPVVPPSRLQPGLPAWLDQVVLRALAKDPAARFPSAAAMRAALLARAPIADRSGVMATVPLAPAPAPKVSNRPFSPRLAVPLTVLGAALMFAILGGRFAGSGPVLPTAASEPTRVSPTAPPATRPSDLTRAVAPTATRTSPPLAVPTPAAQATSTPPRVPTADAALAYRQRLTALRGRVESAAVRNKDAREIADTLAEIDEQLSARKTKEANEKLQDLRKNVRELAREGKIDAALAQLIAAELDSLVNRS